MSALPLLLALGTLATAGEEPARGYLGMKVGTHDGLIEISKVFPGSNAEQAGLEEGDTLVAADGRSLAGLTVKEAVGLLTGSVGSRITVERDPFPPGGPTAKVKVLRGPRPEEEEQGGRSWMPPVEREANVLVGSLRAGRTPAVDHAAKTWSGAEDQKAADHAALRALREADATGWAQALDAAQVATFWSAVAASEPLMAWLGTRPLATRTRAAGFMARHPAAAAAVAALLPEADPGHEGAAALALATAVIAGDPKTITAAGWTPPDLWGPEGELVLGPRAGDLAALELSPPAGGSGRPLVLPWEALGRLEATGMRLPWERAAEAAPFAASEAPVVAPFTATTPDGQTLDLAAHEGPVVLAFWATWCGPCRQEMPHLQALREAHQAEGLEVWALSTDRAKDRARIPEIWEKWGLSLPVAPAPSALVQAWDVRSVPRVVVLDADHRRVIDHQGFSEESFEELEGQVQAVMEGSLKGERSLGQLDGQLELLATGTLPGRPKALVRGPDGGVQVLARGALVPLRRAGDDLRTGSPQRLPFSADQALWADLDGDGQAELLLADGKDGTLRASRADGEALWTRRSAEPIGGFGLLQADDGSALVVTLRAGVTLEDPPPGARGLAPGEQVRVPSHHLEIMGLDGAMRADLPLPGPAITFAAAPDGHAAALALADGAVLTLGPDLALSPVEHPLDRPRGLTWDDADLWISGGAARGLLVGRSADGAPWRMAETGGGDLWALSEGDEVTARLDLQRPVLSVVGDVDGDGREEVVLWAPWFGLAALRP